MGQTALEQSSGAPYSVLVTLRWGVSNVARYCRWVSDLVVGGETFINVPSLKVFMDQPQTGGLDDAPIEVQIRSGLAPFNTLVQLYPHAKVSVVVEEIQPGDDSTLREMFTGQVVRASNRTIGGIGVARCKVAGVKSRLRGRLGLQALSDCGVGYFGDSLCQFDLAAATITGTVTAVGVGGIANRVEITIGSPPSMSNPRWNRGYLEIDGLRISIRRSFDDTVFTFDLREVPPPDWLGETVTLVPGCDRSIETCRVHGREESFLGIATDCPDHNPLFESRQ